MKPGELIEEMKQALSFVTGEGYLVTSRLEEVIGRMAAGETDIPLELPWEEVHAGQRVTRHQVMLLALDAEAGRDSFFTSRADHERAPGTHLGGPMDGPARRTEGGGVESMAFEDFARFFAEGHAYALLRPQT